jgi:aspartate/methionine/tyrosine aminotransferase
MHLQHSYQPHQSKRPVELRTGVPYANLIANQKVFAEAVGNYFGIDAGYIMPTAGTSGAIEAIRNHVYKLSKNRRPMVFTIFPEYWRAMESFEGLGFEIAAIETETSGFTIDMARMLENARQRNPDLIYLSLPNNPTGAIFDPSELIDGAPPETAIMLDLTLPARALNTQAFLNKLHSRYRERRKLFIGGSTSKSHGTAEYRIGWAICTSGEEAIELKKENRNVVSIPAIVQGIRSLQEGPTAIEKIERSFSLLREGARAEMFELIEPRQAVETCYVLIKLPPESSGIKESLRENEINVMWGPEFGLTDDYIRLEMLEPANIEILLRTLAHCQGSEAITSHDDMKISSLK